MEFSIPLQSQPFDITFHPSQPIVFAGLLTGEIYAYEYDNTSSHKELFSLQPSKKSCRSISLSSDAACIYSGGRAKSLTGIDIATQKTTWVHLKAHRASINRVKCISPFILATGDDDGTVNIWDIRETRRTVVRSYSHHFDQITDFLCINNAKQLVATSGDGTLSVLDLRSNQKPCIQSEDQETELLSIAPLDSANSKVVVGTQNGVLSIWDSRKGWGDCVDRALGHPASIDAICLVPESFQLPRAIITGSSDGLVRVSQILPTNLTGILADHGDWPVERIAIGPQAEWPTLTNDDSGLSSTTDEQRSSPSGSICWVGSIGHDAALRLSDLGAFFNQQNSVDLAPQDDGVDVPTAISNEDKNEEEEEESTKKRKRTGKNKDDSKKSKKDRTAPFFGDLC